MSYLDDKNDSDYQKITLQILRKKRLPYWIMRDADELMGRIQESIMDADVKLNKNIPGIEGTDEHKRRIYRSYRANCAIKTYMKELREDSERKKKIMDGAVYKFSNEQPIDSLIAEEDDIERKNKINFLLNNTGLSDTQKRRIKLRYLDGMTLQAIADNEKTKVTKQGVDLSIKDGIARIKRTVGVSNIVR